MIKQFEIKWLKADLISDTHFPVSSDTNRILNLFLENKKSEILFILWDIYDSEKGEDSSNNLINLLNSLSENYKKVIFTGWNHEFRSGKLNNENWYQEFKKLLAENVIVPEAIAKPTIEIIDWVKILVWNIFYDMEFLNPELLWFEKDDILKVYKNIFPDWKYLFDGKIDTFEQMRDWILDLFDDSIDVIATHSLVHPSLVKFITSWNVDRLQEKVWETINVEKYHEWHVRYAEKINISLEDYIKFYNYKSYFMWTNLLKDASKIKNNLLCLHGHSHRDSNHEIDILWKNVKFLSNQYK